MMNQPEQAVTQALDDLQVSTSLLQIVVVHLLAEFANGTVEPVDWVRGFAECVHASIDRADQPTDARSQRMAEMLRDQLDRLMFGVQARLKT